MFLVNSRRPHLVAAYRFFSTEDTKIFCRVPVVLDARYLCILNLFTSVSFNTVHN